MPAGQWHDVLLRPGGSDSSDMSVTRFMSYNIRGLESGSMYEAIVQAKNAYGWNEVSDLYQFYTNSIHDYGGN